MKVLVLAGGYGTRLQSIAKNTPKPLLDVNGKPIIHYILERIKEIDNVTEVLVVTNDKFYNQFEQWAKEQQSAVPFKIKVFNDKTTSNEDRLGSIGDIDFVLKEDKTDDDLLVVGGDNLFDFNLDEYSRFANKNTPHVTIGVYDIGNIDEAYKFGVAELNGSGKIISFEEKPERPKSSLIAMCFYYLPKASLGLIGQYLKETKKSDKAGDYIRWLSETQDVYGFKFLGKWYDIGSVESYQEAQKMFK